MTYPTQATSATTCEPHFATTRQHRTAPHQTLAIAQAVRSNVGITPKIPESSVMRRPHGAAIVINHCIYSRSTFRGDHQSPIKPSRHHRAEVKTSRRNRSKRQVTNFARMNTGTIASRAPLFSRLGSIVNGVVYRTVETSAGLRVQQRRAIQVFIARRHHGVRSIRTADPDISSPTRSTMFGMSAGRVEISVILHWRHHRRHVEHHANARTYCSCSYSGAGAIY